MPSLAARYEAIAARFRGLSDFPTLEQRQSRALFDVGNSGVRPRHFDVWTCVSGLPVPRSLQANLDAAVCRIRDVLPPTVRAYWVERRNYHLEIFVVKRPDERSDDILLRDTAGALGRSLASEPPLTITYRGLLVTPDGTVLAKGYGQVDGLRWHLRKSIPLQSSRQSTLAHISLGRILDPVGRATFAALKTLVARSASEVYGSLPLHQVKYVHERQWYMMDREIIRTFRLGANVRVQH
jgi:hypothetical protein